MSAVTLAKPRWLRNLRRFLPLKPQFLLSGNVRDQQLAEAAPSSPATVSLAWLLRSELRESGYARVLSYAPMNGFRPSSARQKILRARSRPWRVSACNRTRLDRFTEGFETADLKTAKALLHDLS